MACESQMVSPLSLLASTKQQETSTRLHTVNTHGRALYLLIEAAASLCAVTALASSALTFAAHQHKLRVIALISKCGAEI